MFKFNKIHLSALLALVSINMMGSSASADEFCCQPACNRMYIGAFGGGLYSNSTKINQKGTAFFLEADGGPLAVNAEGRTHSNSTGFGGIQLGYEWTQSPYYIGCSDWSLTPGAEVEAFWYHHKKKGDLINNTNRLPEHDFLNSFPMNVGVYLLNGGLTLNSCSLGNFSPYMGVGIGFANISIRNAESVQVSPAEVGVNHFNSDRSDTSWAFATQAKAGLRYKIFERINIFAEYRFLYLDASNYIFGSTIVPGHAVTSPWNVKIQNIYYNAFTVGLQFDL